MGKHDVDQHDFTPAALRYAQADPFTPANALYGPTGADLVSSTGAPTVGDLYAFPFWSAFGGTLDQLGFNVTATAVGAVARVGLYESDSRSKDPTDGMLIPGNLLVDGGQQDCAAATGAKMSTLSPLITLRPRELYWLAFICGVLAPTVTTFTSGWHLFGRNAGFNAQFGWQKVGAGYGALPAVFPAGPPQPGICTSAAALVVARFASYNRFKKSSA